MGKNVIWIIIGFIALGISIFGFYLLWGCTTSAARSQAGNTLLYVFAAIPAVLAIGLVLGIVSGTVFLLLQVSGAYHRQVTRDTIELVEAVVENIPSTSPVSIRLNKDASITSPQNKLNRVSNLALSNKSKYYGMETLSNELNPIFLQPNLPSNDN